MVTDAQKLARVRRCSNCLLCIEKNPLGQKWGRWCLAPIQGGTLNVAPDGTIAGALLLTGDVVRADTPACPMNWWQNLPDVALPEITIWPAAIIARNATLVSSLLGEQAKDSEAVKAALARAVTGNLLPAELATEVALALQR